MMRLAALVVTSAAALGGHPAPVVVERHAHLVPKSSLLVRSGGSAAKAVNISDFSTSNLTDAPAGKFGDGQASPRNNSKTGVATAAKNTSKVSVAARWTNSSSKARVPAVATPEAAASLHLDVDATERARAAAEVRRKQKSEAAAAEKKETKNASNSAVKTKSEVGVENKSSISDDTRGTPLSATAAPKEAAKTQSSADTATEAAHFLARRQRSSVNTTSSNVSSPASDICSCEFRGICGCQAAIEFMDCVAAACNSGHCDCQDTQFEHACMSIAGECSTLEMQCSTDRAACLVEEEAEMWRQNRTKDVIYEELRALKEKRCRLEMAEEDGWLNAEIRLRTVRHDIDTRMEELTSMDAPLPEMHCEKHFEEWHMQPKPAESGASRASVVLGLLLSLILTRSSA